MATSPKVIADFTTQLSSAIAIGGTTATILSNVDDDGNALPTGLYFFTLDGNNSNKECLACTNTGGSLTAIESVSRQGVQTSGAVRAHRVGCSVVMTDWATYKTYIDAATISGISPATTSTLGGVYTTTNTGGSVVVSTDDTRLPTTTQAAALVGVGTPSGTNPYLTQSALDGYLKVVTPSTGADAALDVTTGTTTLNDATKIVGNYAVYNYTTINVSSGATLTVGSNLANKILILKSSSGNPTIAGTINTSGFGGAGGIAGTTSGTLPTNGTVGAGAVFGGGNIPTGTDFVTGGVSPLPNNTFGMDVSNGSGGAGGANGQSFGGGAGGNGGMSVVIVSSTGTITISGTINTSGVAGSNGVPNTFNSFIDGGGAGGGGGGGGNVALIGADFSFSSPTFNLVGGVAGSPSGWTGSNGGTEVSEWAPGGSTGGSSGKNVAASAPNGSTGIGTTGASSTAGASGSLYTIYYSQLTGAFLN